MRAPRSGDARRGARLLGGAGPGARARPSRRTEGRGLCGTTTDKRASSSPPSVTILQSVPVWPLPEAPGPPAALLRHRPALTRQSRPDSATAARGKLIGKPARQGAVGHPRAASTARPLRRGLSPAPLLASVHGLALAAADLPRSPSSAEHDSLLHQLGAATNDGATARQQCAPANHGGNNAATRPRGASCGSNVEAQQLPISCRQECTIAPAPALPRAPSSAPATRPSKQQQRGCTPAVPEALLCD